MKTSIDNWSKGVGEKVSVVLCAVATDERAWVGERAEVGGPGSGPRRAANRLHTFFMRQREQAAQQSVGLKEQGVRSREQSYSRRLESRERRRIRRSASGALTVRATVGNAWRQGRQGATIYARAQPRGGATFSLSSGRELISAAGCSSQCCWQEWSVHQHGGRGVVRRGRGRGVGARAAAAAGGQSAAAHSCRAAAAGGRRRQMRA